MAAPNLGQTKRHRGSRIGERRIPQDAGSSRDASEEDNDEAVSDVGSLMSAPALGHVGGGSSGETSSPKVGPPGPIPLHIMNPPSSHPPPRRASLAHRKMEELSGEEGPSGLDSPTYDGDIESSSTVGGTPVHPSTLGHQHPHHQRRPSSPTPGPTKLRTDIPGQSSSMSPYGQRLPTPKASRVDLTDPYTSTEEAESAKPAKLAPPGDVPVARSNSLPEPKKSQTLPLSRKPSKAHMGPLKMMTRPKELPVEEIRSFVQRAIDGRGAEDGVERWWRTKATKRGQTVRVYADGVYDLFHFGHALALRQCKLAFPQVHLLVGVMSDDLCVAHKSGPVMTHAERCESVRHCRWVDEVLPDGPWVVNQEWMDKHQIDYIAHDEEVYPSKGHEDVYQFVKEQGRFVPTRRTPAISTSDLLERIVRGYRDGFFDSKLEKNGLSDLLAENVDWDSSPSRSRAQSKEGHKRVPLLTASPAPT